MGGGVGKACNAFINGAHPVGRGDTHRKHEQDHRNQRSVLAADDIRSDVIGDELGLWTVEDALDHPEHVSSTENYADGGECCPAPMWSETAAEDEEFADEAVQDGQADERERGDYIEGGHIGQARGEASESAHFIGAVALMEEADEDEEGASRESLVEDLVDSAV